MHTWLGQHRQPSTTQPRDHPQRVRLSQTYCTPSRVCECLTWFDPLALLHEFESCPKHAHTCSLLKYGGFNTCSPTPMKWWKWERGNDRRFGKTVMPSRTAGYNFPTRLHVGVFSRRNVVAEHDLRRLFSAGSRIRSCISINAARETGAYKLVRP